MTKYTKINNLKNLINAVISCYNVEAINNEEMREWIEQVTNLITKINEEEEDNDND